MLDLTGEASVERSSLNEMLERFMPAYLTAKSESSYVNRYSDAYVTLRELAEALAESRPLQERPELKVDFSVGKGSWASIPWIVIRHPAETKTIRSGVYVALLFREDMSGVYLCLTQGVQDLTKAAGHSAASSVLQSRVTALRGRLGDVAKQEIRLNGEPDFRSNSSAARDYRTATVAYSLIEKDAVHEDESLITLLEFLLQVYDFYLDRRRDIQMLPPWQVSVEQPIVEPSSFEMPNVEWQSGCVSALNETLDTYGGLTAPSQQLADAGFSYSEWQLAAYMTALQTKGFVILSGISGTGKTKLVQHFAALLPGHQTNRVTICSSPFGRTGGIARRCWGITTR